ncbi:Nrap protein [Dichomitus squalens]|uniref:U3 small nucleolar RNA-associated protein 22 n=1 Tax=Dichomitus squalens TaxID=114155 RepID=A0A4Q9MB08_9APHY|nr:Nrap protein [Dichomitus squalens]
MDLPSTPPQHPLHASRTLSQNGVAVPYIRPLPTEDTNWKVAFEPPSEIVLAGSWATKTAVKGKDTSKYEVDVAVAIPSSLVQEKDYLNGRVFQKRAYYLSAIASALVNKNSPLPCDLFFQSTSGDPRYTTLVLRPHESVEGFRKLNVQVRIIPFLPHSPIPLQRLSPSRSNVRTSGQDHDSKEEPTPLYNTALMHMITPKAHLLAIHALKQDVPAFSDALTLLRVWANQRGYGMGSRLCVRGFEGKGMWWASVLDMLIHGEEPQPVAVKKTGTKRKPLGKGLSSYQLFKAALDFFARHDFAEQPVYVKSKDGHRFPPMSYASHEAVFVDSTSSVNLLAGVPLSSLDLLRYDAQATLETLDRSGISEDPFHTVFLQDHRDMFSRFDIVLRVDVSSAVMRNPSAHLVADHGSVYNALIATLTSTLRRGLGNRAKAIAVLHPSSDVRPLSQALPANPSAIHIGIVLDNEHAFRLVDHGPPAEDQESEQAKRFRDFWGEKAELRRFKDGSITESVVWDVKSVDERTHIPSLVVKHLLRRHLGIGAEDVKSWQTQFDALLKAPESIRSLYEARGAVAGFKAALTAFDALVKQIKSLDDQFPLAILNVSPVSASLRHTEVFVPIAVTPSSRVGIPTTASYLPAMEVIVEFEKSGRWPDDLRAIQKIKLAFFERMATALMAAAKGLQASVVFGEHTARTEIQDEAALDIVTPDGWAFRVRIWHDREATLLDRVINEQSRVPKALRRNITGEEARERQAALEARDVYLRRFIHAPRHHRVIAALSHKFAAFAGTVRLTKRWFASHWLLCSHVSEEAVELLCAHIFLRTGASVTAETMMLPAGVPGTKERGFAQVLKFLEDWDWTKGLVVPSDFSDQDVATADASPSASGTAPWSLVTQFDASGHVWTSSGPNAVVARRITTLAKATWASLAQSDSQDLEVTRLFQHPTEDYDFVAELNPAVLPRSYQSVEADPSIWAAKAQYANAGLANSTSSVLPGFDPAAALFRDLTRVYEDTALLFYDVMGGAQVGGVWQPSLKNARPFRVLGGYSSLPVSKDGSRNKEKEQGLVVLNHLAPSIEMKRIGSGLITGIVSKID